jgi:nicotinate-nucleotide--dimethylbenzimidazole phosphoribosyltransferase
MFQSQRNTDSIFMSLSQAENELQKLIQGVEAPSETWRAEARLRLDQLTKPLGSLGRLENLAAQLVAIRHGDIATPLRKAAYVFAADHGITAEGVSAYPRDVTHQMVLNFLKGGAAINVLAHLHQVVLYVVDVGVDADLADLDGLLHRKVAQGTRNMLHEAAMTDDQMAAALSVGARLAAEAAARGCDVLAIGEMGIGNTTAASAITCALATGTGTGIDPEVRARKIRVIEATLAQHFGDNCDTAPLDILRCVGGLEIAAMTGMVLAAARHRIAVVADGFISTAAAALAVAMQPKVREYLIAGHRSEEPGHSLLLKQLDLLPVLSLGMRLGEGTGAVLAMPILESAICLYNQMATFASAGVSEASA